MIWLVNSSPSFYPIILQRKFYNSKKQLYQGITQWCQKITVQEHLFGEFTLVHLTFGLCTSPTDNSSFTYHSFNGPNMCAVENFQRLRFGNSQSTDKFKGKPKIVSLPKISQQCLRLHLHCTPYTRSMSHPDTSKCVDLPPITTKSSPHCCIKRRTTFWNWRSKIYRNKPVPNKWYIRYPQ